MKAISLMGLSLFSLVLALVLPSARADDSAVVPPSPLPTNPQTSPADGNAPARHRRPPPGFVLGELTAKLSLTAEQQTTVGGIIASSRSESKAVREDDTLSKEARRQKMQDIRATARQQIRAALTPSQQAIFDTLPANPGKPPVPPAN